jgi:hypothetical protein
VKLREVVIPTPAGATISVQRLGPTMHALARIRFWIVLVGGIGIALCSRRGARRNEPVLRPCSG